MNPLLHLFHIARDVFAVVGLLWLALSVFFAFSDKAKAKGGD